MVEAKKDKIESTTGTNPQKNKPQTEETSPPQEKESGILVEAAKNIEAGVEKTGEKISEIADKTADTAGDIYKSMKKGLSSTYDAGAKVIDEIEHSAHNYFEKYEKNMQMKKLGEERDKLCIKLGSAFFTQYKIKKEENLQFYLKNEEISNMIVEIEQIQKNIIKIGKNLEKN